MTKNLIKAAAIVAKATAISEAASAAATRTMTELATIIIKATTLKQKEGTSPSLSPYLVLQDGKKGVTLEKQKKKRNTRKR